MDYLLTVHQQWTINEYDASASPAAPDVTLTFCKKCWEYHSLMCPGVSGKFLLAIQIVLLLV